MPLTFITKLLLFFTAVRQFVIDVCFRLLPDEEAGILIGVLLGDSRHVSQKMYEAFKKTGTLHLFAASGMNLILFGGFFCEAVNLFVKRKKAEMLSLVAVLFYVFLSGFSPSILRAGVMFGSIATSSLFGRPLKAHRNLLYAAGVLIFVNPELIFNLGFQLSVLSTLGLIVNPGKWLIDLHKVRDNHRFLISLWKIFAADFSTSFSCFLFTAPLLIFTFGQINLLAPLVNLTVLWMIDILMIGGAVMVVADIIGQHFARYFSFLFSPLLIFFKNIILFFGNFGFGVINFTYPDKIISSFIFCLILWFGFLMKNEQKTK